MPELTVAEQMLYSTVKLMALRGGSPVSTGTGFFMNFAQNGSLSVPTIVTNKHVVDGNDEIVVVCHLDASGYPSGSFTNCTVGLGSTVIRHPDPNVDICAIAFGGILEQARQANTRIFNRTLSLDLIPADDDWQYFDAIEEVTMIGCPNGISDQINNLPIVRRGITASSLGKLYNGKPEFLIDMACFPGSSGSPVFLYDRNSYFDRRTNSMMMGTGRVKLVGVLYSGPLITNSGRLALNQLPTVSVNAMMHLGNVIRSSELRVLDNVIASAVSNTQSALT